MTFGELVRDTDWVEVETALVRLFPEQRAQLHAYRTVFGTLLKTVPERNPMRLAIEVRPLPGSNEDDLIPEVVGRNGRLNRELDDCPPTEADIAYGLRETVYSLSYKLWSEWLGMRIEAGTLGAYAAGEIIAHAMVDMTFHGFTEAGSQEVLAELRRRRSEIDAMTDCECARDLVSAEEVIARLRARLGGGSESEGA